MSCTRGRNGSQGIERLAGEYGATPHVVSGNPADALIDVAEQIDAGLIVVGSVGMTGARRFLIGNVPNKVTHHATRDVLVVKTDPVPREMKNYCRIVVGTRRLPERHARGRRRVLACRQGGRGRGHSVRLRPTQRK